jgi:hypothetical protein
MPEEKNDISPERHIPCGEKAAGVARAIAMTILN